MTEEESAGVDHVGADDLHLVGPDIAVGDGLVHLDHRVRVLGRAVVDVFGCRRFVYSIEGIRELLLHLDHDSKT